MGVVYRARQISLNRLVAVKMILAGRLAGPGEITRFRTEAETAARLQHPGIVAIHEIGEHEGCQFFSMDYVAGSTLADMVREQPLSPERAARYMKTIAEAIHYAHQKGVLHRDLKPSNVLVDEHDQPRVTDFGLAKWLENKSELTVTGQVLGSPSFMPPEQAGGKETPVGPYSDIYSLGALLYHLLTGRPPFVADTPTATLRMVAETEPVSPRLLNSGVPRDLETICLKCLEKDPQRRYGTAQEVAEELGRFLRDEPIRARPASRAEKVGRWCRQNRALAMAGATVVLLLLTVAIGSPIAALLIYRERQQAEANQKEAQIEARKRQETARFLASMLEGVGPSVAQGRDIALLKEILDRTSIRIGKDLHGQPEVEADLRIVLGKTYAEMGLYTNALETTQQALRLRAIHLGTNNPLVADAVANIAAFYLSLGDLPNAEKANREALSIRLRLLGNRHTNVATSLNNLSLTVWNQGRLEEAERYQAEALDIRKRLLGNTSLDTGKSLMNLASIQWVRGNFAGAEANLAKALGVFRAKLSPEHPHIAMSQNNLATMLVKKGDLVGAEALHRKTLEVRRRVLNQKHDDIAYSLTQLALVVADRGELKEAETLLHEALQMERELNLGDHPNVADTLAGLGAVLARRGDLAGARTNLDMALQLRKKLLGAENADLADSLDALAVVTAMQGDLVLAGKLVGEALAVNEKALGKEHVNLVPLLYHTAWLSRQQGEPLLAENCQSQALALSARNGLYGAWPFLKGIFDLADILQVQGRFVDAEPLLGEAAAFAQSRLQDNAPLQRVTFQRLVRFYEAWTRSAPGNCNVDHAGAWKERIEKLNLGEGPHRNEL